MNQAVDETETTELCLDGSSSWPVSKFVLVFLGVCVLALTSLSFFSTLVNHFSDLSRDRLVVLFIKFVDLNSERNIPTWFSMALLYTAGLLNLIIGAIHFRFWSRWRWRWILIGTIFVILSFDEGFQIHERANEPMREMFGATGIFFSAWVIPGLAFVLILGLVFWRFVFTLPTPVKALIIGAGATFIAGTIGGDIVGGYYQSQNDLAYDFTYSMITTVEETLEMIGLTIYLYALLRYIEISFSLKLALKREAL